MKGQEEGPDCGWHHCGWRLGNDKSSRETALPGVLRDPPRELPRYQSLQVFVSQHVGLVWTRLDVWFLWEEERVTEDPVGSLR